MWISHWHIIPTTTAFIWVWLEGSWLREKWLVFNIIPSTQKQTHSAHIWEILHMKLVCFAQTVRVMKVMRHWEIHQGVFQPTVPSLNTTVHQQEPLIPTKHSSSAFTAILHVQVDIHKDFTQGWSTCASIRFLSIKSLFSGSPQIIFNGSGERSKASTSQNPSLQTSCKTEKKKNRLNVRTRETYWLQSKTSK